MNRLFVAVWPPEELARRLGTLCPGDEAGVRTQPAEHLHVTLRFLGDADAGEVIDRLAACTFRATTATVGPTVRRLGDRIVVAPVSGLDDLAAVIAEATGDVGESSRRPFAGHITIARTSRGARTSVEGTPVNDRFTVDRVHLVASRRHDGGSEYRTLATFDAT